MDFQVGDIVRLKTGKAPQVVMHVDPHRQVMSTRYESQTGDYAEVPKYYDRKMTDYIGVRRPQPKTQPTKQKKAKPSMSKLYKVKGTDEYGEFLTKDGDGQMVLKMSDGGGFKGFDEDKIEKVCPYTIQLHFTSSGANSGHYRIHKDHGLKVKDPIMLNGALGVVFRLDTQKDDAPEVKGLKKLVVEEVTPE